MSAMKASQGLEWAAHACALLGALPEGACLSGASLAAFHELPPAYMAKHLQALSRAGLLDAVRGIQGGYRLARDPGAITLWDVEAAIAGSEPRFECRNIRARGPCAVSIDPSGPACEIACAFALAEQAYRASLKQTTIANITRSVAARRRTVGDSSIKDWLNEHATRLER
ncbi:Rrf2 family protein [Phenylobacterium haematophilum]|uniref:Rrf2 family protein n=1 Tax=Phenylobacterium haematophilum TaxID=98513 RepID=A0A839ZZJ6_9CAUL|nr:Rrf2 family transcriptional regulator [Phenylobacterium haematophilum]MBB3890592.1 Rrf2 family protein [Phenylobacterium haematophilum]